jgi:uncharacterized protein (UPF0333 family)
MLTKLTLTIEKDVIEKAKEYAQQKNKSVSRIVEEYLKNISQNRTNLAFDHQLKSPITDSLVGMFEDNGKDYKTMLEEARSEIFL